MEKSISALQGNDNETNNKIMSPESQLSVVIHNSMAWCRHVENAENDFKYLNFHTENFTIFLCTEVNCLLS